MCYNVSYSIIFNGGSGSSFVPSCGLRQGDLLSPNLFILCVKVSSCLLEMLRNGVIYMVLRSGGAPISSHICFLQMTRLFLPELHTMRLLLFCSVFVQMKGPQVIG